MDIQRIRKKSGTGASPLGLIRIIDLGRVIYYVHFSQWLMRQVPGFTEFTEIYQSMFDLLDSETHPAVNIAIVDTVEIDEPQYWPCLGLKVGKLELVFFCDRALHETW